MLLTDMDRNTVVHMFFTLRDTNVRFYVSILFYAQGERLLETGLVVFSSDGHISDPPQMEISAEPEYTTIQLYAYLVVA